MNKSLLSFLIAVLPLALFGATGTAIPGGQQATTFVINKPGAYYLAGDRVMTGQAYAAIEVQAPDVTLDLNGFSLSYSEASGYSKNGIVSSGSNVEIRNGSIHTAAGDAIISQGVGFRLIDVRISDTGGIGSHGADSLIERCHITDTRGNGIYLGGRGSVVRNCSVKNSTGDTGYGIWLGSHTTVVGCTIGQTEATGIYCYGSSCVVTGNNVYEANLGKTPGRCGIGASDNCVITENVVARCFANGIKLDYANCLVEKNVINRTQAVSPMLGAGIVSNDGSTIVRGNVGTANAGPLAAGPYINAGDNVGD